MDKAERQAIKRALLLVPCETKEQLHRWIRMYLGVDLPDCIVDPESNSSPMDFVWEIYSNGLRQNPKFSRIMAYAAREAMKTVSEAILELLFVLHLEREVGHMAAIKFQAHNAQRYVKDYCRKPFIKDFVTSDNETRIEFTRYKHPDGRVLSPVEWGRLPQEEQDEFECRINKIVIVVATLNSTNSLHTQLFCVDGDTQIPVLNKAWGRERTMSTARAIFKRLKGVEPSGRGGGETEEIITHPVENINVLSFNLKTGEPQFRPIVRAQCSLQETLEIEYDRDSIICTADHPIYVVGKGFTKASDLQIGDKVAGFGKGLKLSPDEAYPPLLPKNFSEFKEYMAAQPVETNDFDQVLLGSMLGDGGVYKKEVGNPFYSEQHCQAQAGYLAWKRGIIQNQLRTIDTKSISGYTGLPLIGFRTGNSPTLLRYAGFKKTLEGIERLGALGLAVWYMDDGCSGRTFILSSESFSLDQNTKLAAFLKERFLLDVRAVSYQKNGKTYSHIVGGIAAKRRLAQVCAPFIHPDMAYKFELNQNKGQCRECGADFWFYEMGKNSKVCSSVVCRRIGKGLETRTIKSIRPVGQRWVYDFTVAGNGNFFANGILNKNCEDELDLCPPAPLEEAKMVPTQGRNGEPSITVITSSRKFAVGPVQKELDNAHKSGLHVRHWNIIDVTEPCPKERHLPDKPKLPIYVDDTTLSAIPKEDFDLLSTQDKEKYKKFEGYEGCLKNCQLFSVCRGRLATDQKSKSKMLKRLDEVQTKFKAVDVDYAKAQLMCWKPSKEGMIYPRLDRDVHCLTAQQMAERITGDEYPKSFGKSDLIELMKRLGMRFYTGVDHGHTHLFAVVTGAVSGSCMYVFDVIAKPELELSQKVDELAETFGLYGIDPDIYPDPEAPGDNKTLARRFRVRHWKKGPGSVVEGIQIVRMKLNPTMKKEPELFFLKDDPGVELLVSQLIQYHWKVDAAERLTNEPDKVDDDLCDACRYLVMNVFGKHGQLTVGQSVTNQSLPTQTPQQQWGNQLKDRIRELTGGSDDSAPILKGKLYFKG